MSESAQWIEAWSTLAAALFAAIAAIFAYRAYRKETRIETRLLDAEERSQASKVAAWIGIDPRENANSSYIEWLIIRNASEVPIYNVTWANAWDDVANDLNAAILELGVQAGEGRITRAAVLKSQRLQNALVLIEDKLNDLFEQSGQLAINGLDNVVNNAGTMQERLIGSQLPATERNMVRAWSRVDAGQVAAIVQRSTEQITKLSFPLADEATSVMRRELVRGLVNGTNPRTVAANMVGCPGDNGADRRQRGGGRADGHQPAR